MAYKPDRLLLVQNITIHAFTLATWYQANAGGCPGHDEVRLPNPVDLKLFDKTCFLNNGELTMSATR